MPSLHQGDGEPGPLEFVIAAAVLGDIRTFKIYNRIEECHGFGQTAATSCPRSVAISRRRASVSASISSVRLTRFMDKVYHFGGRVSSYHIMLRSIYSAAGV